MEVDAERHLIRQREFADQPRCHAIGKTRTGGVVRGHAPKRARNPGKEQKQHGGDGDPLREHPERDPQRCAPAAGHGRHRGRPREHLQRGAQEDDGGNGRGRGEQRLAVEERRDDQQAREAHDQGSVARPARLEVLDADQHEQEGDAGIAADEIAHRLADRQGGDEREDAEHPGPDDLGRRARPPGGARDEHETQADERYAEDGNPRRHEHQHRQLRGQQQRAQPPDLARGQRVVAWRGRRPALFRKEQVGGASWNGPHACGCRRCAAPRGGAIHALGRPGGAWNGPHACGCRRCAAPRGEQFAPWGGPAAFMGPVPASARARSAQRGGARVPARPPVPRPERSERRASPRARQRAPRR